MCVWSWSASQPRVVKLHSPRHSPRHSPSHSHWHSYSHNCTPTLCLSLSRQICCTHTHSRERAIAYARASLLFAFCFCSACIFHFAVFAVVVAVVRLDIVLFLPTKWPLRLCLLFCLFSLPMTVAVPHSGCCCCCRTKSAVENVLGANVRAPIVRAKKSAQALLALSLSVALPWQPAWLWVSLSLSLSLC